jgi:hypothetical protein
LEALGRQSLVLSTHSPRAAVKWLVEGRTWS